MRCFGYGFLIRLAFSLLGQRLNFLKIIKSRSIFEGILRFAVMCGLFSFNFNITRYLLDKYNPENLGLDGKVFIGGLMSSLALFLA